MICKQCGKEFYIKPSHRSRRKHCSCECMAKTYKGQKHTEETKAKMRLAQDGEKHNNWKGGKIIQRNYVFVYAPTHPRKHHNKIAEHIFEMEKMIGRFLKPEERIHHKNSNTLDNRIQNLQLFANNSEHIKIHNRNRDRDKIGRFIK